MDLNLPIIAVIGNKKTGKTSVVEFLTQAFNNKGINVVTAKHISQKNFSIDDKDTDTYRHYHAGAKRVISVSHSEIAVLIRDIKLKFSLESLGEFIKDADLLLLEGFSKNIIKNPNVGKIVCIKNRELSTYKNAIKGEIIAFCSLNLPESGEVLNINNNIEKIFNDSLIFYNRSRMILGILNSLPRINCKKCGYQSCEEMAFSIYKGIAKINNCITLTNKEKSKIRIKIDGEELPLNPFVSNMIYGVTMSMLESLKRTSINRRKKLSINVM